MNLSSSIKVFRNVYLIKFQPRLIASHRQMALRHSIIWMSLSLLFCASDSFAGRVRDLSVNDKSMKPIYLKMGQSTVLRFKERPQKIVIGNQNYFNVEFIGNDVTIQPQGHVTSNLFVYGKHHTYGFILKVTKGPNYDDLVKVHWKAGGVRYRSHQVRREAGQVNKLNRKNRLNQLRKSFVNPGLKLTLEDQITATIVKIMKLNPEGLYLMDIEVKNISGRLFKTSELDVLFTRGGKKLNPFEFVFESDEIPINRSTRCRIVFHLNKIRGFTLHLKYKEKNQKIIIKRRFL